MTTENTNGTIGYVSPVIWGEHGFIVEFCFTGYTRETKAVKHTFIAVKGETTEDDAYEQADKYRLLLVAAQEARTAMDSAKVEAFVAEASKVRVQA